jgi:galactokinase
MAGETIRAGVWAARLTAPDRRLRQTLAAIYGDDTALHADRLALLRRVVDLFLARFGDRPLRLFRSPGRINLRGMHVDTHGGYLNLMTHQRETVLAVSPSSDSRCAFANVDPGFEEVSFDVRRFARDPAFSGEWTAFLAGESGQSAAPFPRGHWGRYMLGCALRLQHARPDTPLRGLVGVVGSDIPRGAALSSSAALCVAGVSAFAGVNELALTPEERILFARDAEWYAGSRCGVSDQAAMVLGDRGQVVNVALWADRLDVSGARKVTLPPDADVLVIDSRTSRSLSGNAFVEYTRNRFAYSLAMAILRQEMEALGYPPDQVERADRLSRVTPEHIPALAEPARLYALLARVPEYATLRTLRERYRLPELDRAREQYFGSLPPEDRPREVPLRGPLLFGIAESERARVLADLLAEGRIDDAGRLMSIGHDGDRRVTPDGASYRFPVDDDALAAYARDGRPVVECPGAYGASSPVLDSLVDAALAAGARGACLTGAGIAGAVLALCRTADTPRVADALRRWMATPDYARLAALEHPLEESALATAVLLNRAVAPAGELPR